MAFGNYWRRVQKLRGAAERTLECIVYVHAQTKIVNLLDRPGGHHLPLGAFLIGQVLSGDRDLSVIYDDMWIDVIDKPVSTISRVRF